MNENNLVIPSAKSHTPSNDPSKKQTMFIARLFIGELSMQGQNQVTVQPCRVNCKEVFAIYLYTHLQEVSNNKESLQCSESRALYATPSNMAVLWRLTTSQ